MPTITNSDSNAMVGLNVLCNHAWIELVRPSSENKVGDF